MNALPPRVVSAAVTVLAAVGLIAAMGAPWYLWEIAVTAGVNASGEVDVLGTGEVDAWHAWAALDIAVVAMAGSATVLVVMAVSADRPKLLRVAVLPAAGALVGVVYMMIDKYGTPGLTSLETETVTLGRGAWLALGASLGLLAATVYAGWRPRSARDRSSIARNLPSLTALVLATGLAIAGTVMAHEPEESQKFYSNGAAPAYEKCGEGRAKIGHGNYNRGYTRSATYALTAELVYPPNCARLQPNRPNGTISTRFVYQIRNNGQWGGCDSSNLQKNADGDAVVEAFRNYAQHPCGSNHYYRTHGFFGYLDGAKDKWFNADWNSKEHWFG